VFSIPWEGSHETPPSSISCIWPPALPQSQRIADRKGTNLSNAANTLGPHTRMRYFCSPHHQDSPLYPIIAQLERACGFARDDTSDTKLAKLETVLMPASPSVEEVTLIVAELHRKF
jgi:hypothetical protein